MVNRKKTASALSQPEMLQGQSGQRYALILKDYHTILVSSKALSWTSTNSKGFEVKKLENHGDGSHSTELSQLHNH